MALRRNSTVELAKALGFWLDEGDGVAV
jgi:hypothetical protein